MDIDRFRNVPFVIRRKCMVCGKVADRQVIDLPGLPMTEIYVREKTQGKLAFADQGFHFCRNCGHGQLVNVVDTELQYGSPVSYHFRTSESATGSESADFFIDFVKLHCRGSHFGTVVEPGCNDLYMLKQLEPMADRLVGIDPMLKGAGDTISHPKITAIGNFFENVELEGKIDLVLCKDTLEHVSDPVAFVKKIVDKGNDETLFFFQFPILETLLSGCRFDQVFHQHLNYFTLKSTLFMLNLLGCRLIDYTINVNHWGAIIVAFRKASGLSVKPDDVWNIKDSDILKRYTLFRKNMEVTAARLEFLGDETIYGYGAALMLPVLAYHLGTDLGQLKCIIDDDKTKAGLYYINLPVSIVPTESVEDLSSSVVLITAIASMNNTRRILTKLVQLNPKQIILPLSTI